MMYWRAVSKFLFVTPVQFGRDDDGFLSKKLCGERKLVPIYDYPGERPVDSQNEEEVPHNYVESLIPEGPEATTFYDPGGELHIWFRKTSRKVDQHLQPLRLKVIITPYRQSIIVFLLFIYRTRRWLKKSGERNTCRAMFVLFIAQPARRMTRFTGRARLASIKRPRCRRSASHPASNATGTSTAELDSSLTKLVAPLQLQVSVTA